jgi:hypothetical protein
MLTGVDCTLDKCREILPSRSSGHSFAELTRAFATLGITATFVNKAVSEIPDGPNCYVVQLSNPDHFVVSFLKGERGLYCFDAAGRRVVLRMEDLGAHWTGNLLALRGDHATVRSDAHPRLRFATLYRDLGDLDGQKSETEMKFPFVNDGREPLRILNVDASCSCIKVSAPREAVPPGGAGAVTARFRVAGADRFVQTIYVRSNDPASPFVTLTASAGRTPWAKMSQDGVRFGNVVAGSTKAGEVVVQLQHDSIKLLRATCSLHQVVVEINELSYRSSRSDIPDGVPGPNRASYRLTIRIEPKALPDRGSEFISGEIVLHTDDHRLGPLRLPVCATVVAPIRVVPNALQLDKGGRGKLLIIDERGNDVRVLRTNAADIGLKAIVEDRGNRSAAIASLLVEWDGGGDVTAACDFEIEVCGSTLGSTAVDRLCVPLIVKKAPESIR